MYLVDTNVISELRRTKSRPADARVAAWTRSVETERTFISVITLFELERGMLSVARRDNIRGAALSQWLNDNVLPGFLGRILPISADVAVRSAALHVPTTRPERDAWIAATALIHGLTVVTRDVADFMPMGVPVLNPWEFSS